MNANKNHLDKHLKFLQEHTNHIEGRLSLKCKMSVVKWRWISRSKDSGKGSTRTLKPQGYVTQSLTPVLSVALWKDQCPHELKITRKIITSFWRHFTYIETLWKLWNEAWNDPMEMVFSRHTFSLWPHMCHGCLCWRCTRAGSDQQPDVILFPWALLMQVWPNTIYYWGGLYSAVPMGGGPCSAGTATLVGA